MGHKTQSMTSKTPEIYFFLWSQVFPRIIQVIVTIVINFDERERDMVWTWISEPDSGRLCETGSMEKACDIDSCYHRDFFLFLLCTVNAANQTVMVETCKQQKQLSF